MTRSIKYSILKVLLLFLATLPANLQARVHAETDTADASTTTSLTHDKKSIGQRLLTPIKWISRNWSAYDPRYSLPSFYNWVGQIQYTTSFERLHMQTPEGIDIMMDSQLSNHIGPYFGYQWLLYGFTIDLNSIGKPTKHKSELTISVNSHLMNIDLIHRRTGGDFNITKLITQDGSNGTTNLTEAASLYGGGEYVKNSLTGININIFTNHLKYSNPAAFSHGSIQIRSAGSPIVGFGYTHQKVETNLPEMLTSLTAGTISQFPSKTTINDLHLQLGYAYNIAFSRRLLLGLSAIAAPSYKYIKTNGADNALDDRNMSLDIFLRSSLTYNYNRWRAGLNASFNHYLYNNGGMRVSNDYGTIALYASYRFGRRSAYRYNGRLRQDYINAALSKRQIAEMRDTVPNGNISSANHQLSEHNTKKYHKDNYKIQIYGCDLVKGPEGRYGWYEIEDGYVTPGEDTEQHVTIGTTLEIDRNGSFRCELGHNSGIRAGNWWKSQLRIDQLPNYWYPELLHYALRGKLTLYLRGHIFGTKKPVKLEIMDFCINHGREVRNFSQIGIKSFTSNSGYSIEGKAEINGHPCRIYIEQTHRGKHTNMYISRLYASRTNWMAQIEGSRPLSYICIPGTHDSGTATISEYPSAIFRASHTQNFSVPAQLADGIRAFDIRLKPDLHYGHTLPCRETLDSTLHAWSQFLAQHPTETIIALIGSDDNDEWDEELTDNYNHLVNQYKHIMLQDFSPSTPLDSVRGKILILRRQETCPFGRLLQFSDNTIFQYDCFHVEDIYKEHKTYRKARIVEQHIREAYENDDPNLWYITFNSIAWSPRRHTPYSYAWGGKAKNIRRPTNETLVESIELKDYTDFGIVFLDFYNDHGDRPKLVETIIRANYRNDDE